MDKATLITLIGTGITIIGFVYAFMRNFKTDVNNHIDKVSQGLTELAKEMKEENRKMDQRVIQTNARMDGVYNVLLKRTENLK